MKKQIVKDKKGSIVMGIVYIAAISMFAIFLLLLGYVGNEVGTKVKNQLNDTSSIHSASINKSLDTTINISTQTLGIIWYISFGGLLLGVLISAVLMRTYPLMYPVFIILLVCSILVAVAMSNAYEQIGDSSQLTTAASQQGMVGFMMNKLPYIALVVGLFAIFLAIVVNPKQEALM